MVTTELERTGIAQVLAEAKTIYAELEGDLAAVEHGARSAVWRAFLVGGKLLQIREMVGKGNWLLWLEANWTELSVRTAQLWMLIAHSNEGATCVDELNADSVRKFMHRFVPDKQRPELDGDRTLPKHTHHLSVANTWMKWKRELEVKKLTVPKEELRRDFKPMYDWLCDLFEGEN